MVVAEMTISASIGGALSVSTSSRMALTSPTDTPCRSTRGRRGAGIGPVQPSRPAQSVLILPVRIIRTSHTGAVTTARTR